MRFSMAIYFRFTFMLAIGTLSVVRIAKVNLAIIISSHVDRTVLVSFEE